MKALNYMKVHRRKSTDIFGVMYLYMCVIYIFINIIGVFLYHLN